ncbi:dienelactone hydrolase family protein [Azoarcus sp. KH32C]|uniref:dienelactone hydrolase family protein n=1 Tax=Azoarcus sp. KH32C TaxID=748247 RepID=UPI0002385BA3|nr:dienelactone hydrolase family protein [Azoarcus sp. KH32C]BAL27286.1 dienelactone hydrolase [Azoarcus sp. KH32C]
MIRQASNETIRIPSGDIFLEGMLQWPSQPASGIVVFAHGSGSSRLSPRNNFVAAELRQSGLATLLMDLLTLEEDADYTNRFDIDILTDRLLDAMSYLDKEAVTASLPVGAFGASTGAAAALRLSAALPDRVAAVVSRGGRPDLAGSEILTRIRTPTLLIVGSLDTPVIELNEAAYRDLGGIKEIRIVPGATHLFEEPGTLEQVAKLAAAWFNRYL